MYESECLLCCMLEYIGLRSYETADFSHPDQTTREFLVRRHSISIIARFAALDAPKGTFQTSGPISGGLLLLFSVHSCLPLLQDCRKTSSFRF